MASIDFDNGTTVPASWFNDVDALVYEKVVPAPNAGTLALTSDIRAHRTEGHATNRTLDFYVQSSRLRMANYCDPTSDTPTQVRTAILNAIADAKAGGKALEFTPGAIYTVDGAIEFLGGAGIVGLRIWGNGATIFRSSGAGPVVSWDTGADGDRGDAHEFYDFILKGNAASTNGLYSRGMVRSRVGNIRVVDVAAEAFKFAFSVLNEYRNLISSDNVDTFTVTPTTGILLCSAGLFASSANTFINPAIEAPLSNVGLDLNDADMTLILGGSFEGIPRGAVVRNGSRLSVFQSVDFEANSVYDVEVFGQDTSFRDCNMSSAGSSGTAFVQSTAINTKWDSGFLRTVAIDASSLDSSFDNVQLSDAGGLGFTGAGTSYRTRNVSLVDINLLPTSRIPDRQGPVGTYTGTLTGCTTSPTGTIDYRVDGDVVTLNIPSIIGTSNSTACTITGMPAAIRPTAQRSDIGTVSENSVGSLGRYVIETSGVLTLNVNASTAFTAAGTKGSVPCTITYKL